MGEKMLIIINYTAIFYSTVGITNKFITNLVNKAKIILNPNITEEKLRFQRKKKKKKIVVTQV